MIYAARDWCEAQAIAVPSDIKTDLGRATVVEGIYGYAQTRVAALFGCDWESDVLPDGETEAIRGIPDRAVHQCLPSRAKAVEGLLRYWDGPEVLLGGDSIASQDNVAI